MKRLPILIWEYENKDKGWFVAYHKQYKICLSNMGLCWWISVIDIRKNSVFEIAGSQENFEIAAQQATTLFYFYYTEPKS